MTSSTPKYAIPYSTGTDGLDTVDDTMKALAERVDLMIGEAGDTSITPSAADTNTSVRVNYSRSYAAAGVPKVLCAVNESRAVATTVWVWSSAEDATGFTLNIRASSTATRSVRWVARP